MKRTRDWGPEAFASITHAELAAAFERTVCSDPRVVVLPRNSATLCAAYPACACGEADQRSLDEIDPQPDSAAPIASPTSDSDAK